MKNKQQTETETPKLCSSCRRKTINGVKVIKGISFIREFCYSKQAFLENIKPLICNGYKKIFEFETQNINSSNN